MVLLKLTTGVYFFFVASLALLESGFHLVFIIPTIYRISIYSTTVYLTILCFVVVNILGNYYFASNINTLAKPVSYTYHLPGEIRYCNRCKNYFPFRSWHCIWCNGCILKRDHHCFIIGNCVGQDNHRYFFPLVIYTVMYSSIVVSFCYLLNLPTVIFPRVLTLGFNVTITRIWSMFHLLFLICEISILLIQINVLVTGKMLLEKHTRYANYDCGLKNNVINILGIRWYLVWLCPWIHSPLLVEGGSIKENRMFKDVIQI